MAPVIPQQNEIYETLLEEIEESIIQYQKVVKAQSNDKRFNARAYFAKVLGYKDERILYRFLDPNDLSRAKIGIQDIQKIVEITKDITPLENFFKSLKNQVKE